MRNLFFGNVFCFFCALTFGVIVRIVVPIFFGEVEVTIEEKELSENDVVFSEMLEGEEFSDVCNHCARLEVRGSVEDEFGSIENFDAKMSKETESRAIKVFSDATGELSDAFILLVGMSGKEQREVEEVLSLSGAEIEEIQQERLVSLDKEGRDYFLPSYPSEGAKLREKVYMQIRDILTSDSYERFVENGETSIESSLSYFGEHEYYFNFSFHPNGTRSRLEVRGSGETGGEAGTRYLYDDNMIGEYAHLFFIDSELSQ